MNTGGAVRGATVGAAGGSLLGPWGTAIGALGGGLLGLFSPDEQANADAAKAAQLAAAQKAYSDYRPVAQHARMGAMQNQQNGYDGALAALAQMYGSGMAQKPIISDPLAAAQAAQPPPPAPPAPWQGSRPDGPFTTTNTGAGAYRRPVPGGTGRP